MNLLPKTQCESLACVIITAISQINSYNIQQIQILLTTVVQLYQFNVK